MAHDRTGEVIDPDRHPDNCDGFIGGRQHADPPLKPCPICRPHLARERLEAKLHGPYADPQPQRDNP
ncbi:hypothetical protein [Amycolatopsis plumensis]